MNKAEEDIRMLKHVLQIKVCCYFTWSYKHFSCQSSCFLLLLEVCKNHYSKENSVDSSKQGRDTLFWIHLRDLAKRIYITLGVYEFLNIHIFNWYKALYSASSITFRDLHLHQLCIHKYVKYWVLYSIIAYTKQIKIQDITLTRIRLLL